MAMGPIGRRIAAQANEAADQEERMDRTVRAGDLPATGGGLDPSAFPASAAVGQDIPETGIVSDQEAARRVYIGGDPLPSSIEPTEVVERRRARSLVIQAAAAIPRRDGRGATRHDSVAITKLEEALLWLSAEDIL